jgi:hypothetical protein
MSTIDRDSWTGADESQAVPGFALQTTAFLIELERAIRLLEGMRLRLSLFVLRPTGGPVEAADLSAALTDLGMIGGVGGSSLGLLYVGPRLHGPEGDGAVERQVARRASTALRRTGREASPTGPAIGVVHFWSDSSVEIFDLIAEADLSKATVARAAGSHRGEEKGP